MRLRGYSLMCNILEDNSEDLEICQIVAVVSLDSVVVFAPLLLGSRVYFELAVVTTKQDRGLTDRDSC